MDAQQRIVAEECTAASEKDRMSFSQVLGALAGAGFEGYFTDLRRAVKIYYLPDGGNIEIATGGETPPVADVFDSAAIAEAVRWAQAAEADYSYKGFCERIMAAGCMGYLVSLLGRRAVYFGRTGETYVEHFPNR
ncbi:uncharacterized protein YbcV (DUF1398 family) [Rhizobium sp. BK529]|uniref:DUF1398 family protein n=1 Tax=unclassified Rhizobium TaxID=2613769 RepID=UPI001051556F|nr:MULTISPECIES: DUF1398 family protein [unclassified Rhizobium]MBB3592062.1 uncharacterized protein YbcV (DUF1398 family) [Rhizobium sp. BK529]TCS06485.1 uncharacterized protein YbcV (DUF1398 family) [Rhizobium sp. BK418]